LALTTHRIPAYRQARAETFRRGPLARLALPLAGAAGLTAALALTAIPGGGTAHAAAGLTYQPGYSVQGTWLCLGWSSGAYHCTQHWYRDSSGNFVSLNPAWVPTSTGATGTQTSAQTSTGRDGDGDFDHDTSDGPAAAAPAPTTSTAPVTYSGGSGVGLAPEPCSPNVPSTVWSVAYWQPGAVPPGCYGGVFGINPANYTYRPYFGECNWWVEVVRPDEPGMPFASNFAHMSTPRVGGTVYYYPGVDGAGSTGHYGHIESVSPNGQWLLTSEMNFYWRGGGFGMVVYRYVQVTGGMYFIW
jgi:hypothetical protein